MKVGNRVKLSKDGLYRNKALDSSNRGVILELHPTYAIVDWGGYCLRHFPSSLVALRMNPEELSKLKEDV